MARIVALPSTSRLPASAWRFVGLVVLAASYLLAIGEAEGGALLAAYGNLLASRAVCLASQAVSGLCLGLVCRRAGNLVAPGVVHVTMNSLGQTFG